MTNENKKINELVAGDDDPTSELEALTARHFSVDQAVAVRLEADEPTFEAEDPTARGLAVPPALARAGQLDGDAGKLIEGMRFEFEQVRARWLGQQAELRSREQICKELEDELRDATRMLSDVTARLRSHEDTIGELRQLRDVQQQEIDDLRVLAADKGDAEARIAAEAALERAEANLRRHEGDTAHWRAACADVQERYDTIETYADGLRRQLAELLANASHAADDSSELREKLDEATATITGLADRLSGSEAQATKLADELAGIRARHDEEIRVLRFELTTAQETLADSHSSQEQLLSDLAKQQESRDELEHALSAASRGNDDEVKRLQAEVEALQSSASEYERKLEIKSNAIQALMEEVSRQNLAAAQDLAVVEEPDGTNGRSDERVAAGERVTRLLVGQFDGQELRFPLFRDRLTIGRRPSNDICLNADYISRRHAVILTEGGHTRIADWGSKNGVYVNGNRVTEHFLQSGDKVTIGAIDFRYEERSKRD